MTPDERVAHVARALYNLPPDYPADMIRNADLIRAGRAIVAADESRTDGPEWDAFRDALGVLEYACRWSRLEVTTSANRVLDARPDALRGDS